MSRYELHTIHPDTGAKTDSIRFCAGTVVQALTMAHRLVGDEPVELWQDNRRLCRIQRSRREAPCAPFWMVS